MLGVLPLDLALDFSGRKVHGDPRRDRVLPADQVEAERAYLDSEIHFDSARATLAADNQEGLGVCMVR